MANWWYSIELNKVIAEFNEEYPVDDGEFSQEVVPEEYKKKVIAELEKAPPLRCFISEYEKANTVAETNSVLQKIFDEADRRMVWCGFGF